MIEKPDEMYTTGVHDALVLASDLLKKYEISDDKRFQLDLEFGLLMAKSWKMFINEK